MKTAFGKHSRRVGYLKFTVYNWTTHFFNRI